MAIPRRTVQRIVTVLSFSDVRLFDVIVRFFEFVTTSRLHRERTHQGNIDRLERRRTRKIDTSTTNEGRCLTVRCARVRNVRIIKKRCDDMCDAFEVLSFATARCGDSRRDCPTHRGRSQFQRRTPFDVIVRFEFVATLTIVPGADASATSTASNDAEPARSIRRPANEGRCLSGKGVRNVRIIKKRCGRYVRRVQCSFATARCGDSASRLSIAS